MTEKKGITITQEKSALTGGFEGASRISRELAMWSPSLQSADGEILPDKSRLDARGRDMSRNDGYAHGAANTFKDSIVGGMYLLNARPKLEVLKEVSPGFNEEWAENFQRVAETKWNLYAESPMCWLDASRQMSFTGLVRMSIAQWALGGESLGTAEWIRDSSRPYKTAIQMVDTDRLSNPYDAMDMPNLRGGVESDRYGAPVAYHIRRAHPSSVDLNAYSWRRVPVRTPWGRTQVIHLKDAMRPEQTRGISDMVAVLKQMRMTAKFSDIMLQNAVVNATYAAVIESDLPPAEAFASLGEGSAQTWAEDHLGAIAEYTGQSRNMHLDGTKITHLYPGTKLKMLNAGQPGGVGTVFEESLLRKIAAGLGLSYEQFTKDFTKTNYSSARATMGETGKRMAAVKKMMADRFATSVYQLWLEEAISSGELPLPAGVKKNFFYKGQNKDAISACSWIGASKGQIDELKETQAAVMRINTGLSTYEDEANRLGKDWREVFEQRSREQKYAEKLGILLNPNASKSDGMGGSGVLDDKKPGTDQGRQGPGEDDKKDQRDGDGDGIADENPDDI